METLSPMPDWMVLLLGRAYLIVGVYLWVLILAGLLLSVGLAKRWKQRGFYLVGASFLSPVFDWVIRAYSHYRNMEALEAYATEMNWKMTSGEVTPVIDQTVGFPIFETLLVAGLFILWRRKEGPIQPPQRNAGSRPPSGDSPASETPSSLGPRG